MPNFFQSAFRAGHIRGANVVDGMVPLCGQACAQWIVTHLGCNYRIDACISSYVFAVEVRSTGPQTRALRDAMQETPGQHTQTHCIVHCRLLCSLATGIVYLGGRTCTLNARPIQWLAKNCWYRPEYDSIRRVFAVLCVRACVSPTMDQSLCMCVYVYIYIYICIPTGALAGALSPGRRAFFIHPALLYWPFFRAETSAQPEVSGSYHLPGMCAVLSERVHVCFPCAKHGYSAEMTRVSGCAYHAPDVSTFERHARGRVCLPCARHGYSAEMTRVSGCAYHAPDMSTFERHARGRVRLPCATHRYSAEMTRVGGCAYHAPDISTLERHARGRVLTMCQHFRRASAQP